MPEPESVLMCRLVSEGPPLTQCEVKTCDDCKRAVWRALSSPKADLILCGSCTAERWMVDSHPYVAPMTDAQLRDIREAIALGPPDGDDYE